MIQDLSIAPKVAAQVRKIAAGYLHMLVCLDSNHTDARVLAELQDCAALTSAGSYRVVYDTLVEDVPADMFPDRRWATATTRRPPCGNTPKPTRSSRRKQHPAQAADHGSAGWVFE
jgi:cephalosporin hydroxylase